MPAPVGSVVLFVADVAGSTPLFRHPALACHLIL
jgi:hypothetical protein